MRIIFLLLSILCFVSSSSSSAAYDDSFETNNEIIEEATLLLESIGITDLCHPSTDKCLPHFPKCRNEPEQEQQQHSNLRTNNYQLISTTTTTKVHSKNNSTIKAAATTRRRLESEETTTSEEKEDAAFYIRDASLALLCVCTAALAAGLTLGLLSIEPMSLLIKIRTASSEEEKRQASSLLPIVRQHHLLLVSLLLLNSIANEALPLFLDPLVPGYMTIIISVTLVLLFGEILPSAIFTGPNRLEIASNLAPLVKVIMFILYPIAYPISRVLDIFLDHEDDPAYTRGELSALVRIQYEERLAHKKHKGKEVSMRKIKKEIERIEKSERNVNTSNLHYDEVNMVEGALKMDTKTVIDIYTPMRNVSAFAIDTKLTEDKVVEIYSTGHSRIPIYQKNNNNKNDKKNIVGVLLTRQLMVVNTSDERLVSTLPLQTPHCVSPEMHLVDLINLLQTPSVDNIGGHMAIVCARPDTANRALGSDNNNAIIPDEAGVMGIVTLEDCLEELLQEEIYDEMDRKEVENHRLMKKFFNQWKNYVVEKKKKQNNNNNSSLEIAKKAGAADTSSSHDIHKESTPLLSNNSNNDSDNNHEALPKRKKSFLNLF